MAINFLKKYWQIILCNLLVIICFIIGYGRFGNVIVDCFREAYIPEQIIHGQALYKNIFSIYAPFAYLFNALLFLIFGVKLKVLYGAGLAATLIIINLFFKIAEIFMSKTAAFSLVFFFIASAVLSSNVFNTFFPYSYGIIYGLLFILASVYCALKEKYTAAYLFYSFAVCSKYEFIFILPLLIYMSGKKDIWKNIAGLIIPILVVYMPVFFSGAGFEDLLISAQWILSMASAKTLYWFYSVSGLVFRPELIVVYFINIIKLVLPLAVLYFFKNWLILPFVFVYLYFFVTPEILVFAFPLIFILFIRNYRMLNAPQRFIIMASLLVSIKIFFALLLKSYGIYFIPFALISMYILTPEKLKKSFIAVIILCAIVLGVRNIKSLAHKNVKISSDRGVVYTTPYYGNSINELIKYFDKTSGEDILVYPEGLIVNFLTGNKSDNKFYSLIPLYTETFGENLIIKRFEIKKPKYIVISNYNTSDYYYSSFGGDYAGALFLYVLNKYELKKEIKGELEFRIYELKSSHLSP